MNDVDIPFKLIISLIVIESMFFQAKKSGGENGTQTTNAVV